eukprot:1175735-Prorocentrum_minimum.AAC.2
MIRNSKISDENVASRGKKRGNITARKKSVKPKALQAVDPNSPRISVKTIDKNVATGSTSGTPLRKTEPSPNSATKSAKHIETTPRKTCALNVLPDVPASESPAEGLKLHFDVLADEGENFATWLQRLDLSVSEKENARQQLQGMLCPRVKHL